MRRCYPAVLWAALVLAGCGAEEAGPVSSPASGPAQPTSHAVTSPEEPMTTSPVSDVARTAAEDLAQRLEVRAEAVQVLRAEQVTWPNAALGCPEPGMAYAEVLTEGVLVELEVNGQTYRYHAGGQREPFLCENPEEPATAPN